MLNEINFASGLKTRPPADGKLLNRQQSVGHVDDALMRMSYGKLTLTQSVYERNVIDFHREYECNRKRSEKAVRLATFVDTHFVSSIHLNSK